MKFHASRSSRGGLANRRADTFLPMHESTSDGSPAVYVTAEQKLTKDAADPTRKLSCYALVGERVPSAQKIEVCNICRSYLERETRSRMRACALRESASREGTELLRDIDHYPRIIFVRISGVLEHAHEVLHLVERAFKYCAMHAQVGHRERAAVGIQGGGHYAYGDTSAALRNISQSFTSYCPVFVHDLRALLWPFGPLRTHVYAPDLLYNILRVITCFR
eukprot:IDg16304t1